jgi:hypothetical protein
MYMNGFRRALLLALTTIALAAAGSANAATLAPVATSGEFATPPLSLASPPNDPRQFVTERGGAIRVIKDGGLLTTPFLTVPSISTDGERGLSSIAFAPDYATSGHMYVFAATGGELRILEYTIPTPSADVAAGATVRTVLAIPDNDAYHNGGQLMFGPDGYLYVTVGDDHDGANAQTLSNNNGKILRLGTANAGPGYTVPPDNPFVGVPGASPLIWALGFRNPFRASFDSSGRLITGDVGEITWEELDVVSRGANYGWPNCEGPMGSCGSPLTSPAYTYKHGAGAAAVIGGYEARDPALTGMTGCYVFGDLASKSISMIEIGRAGAAPVPTGLALNAAYKLWSFGEDSAGHLYVLGDGTVYKVIAGGSTPATCIAPPGTPAKAPAVKIQTKKLRAGSKHRLKIRLNCPGGTTACNGTVTVRSLHKIRVNGKKRSVVFASAKFKAIAPGDSKTITLAVRKLGRQALRADRKIRVRISVHSTLTGVTGTTTHRDVTLRR